MRPAHLRKLGAAPGLPTRPQTQNRILICLARRRNARRRRRRSRRRPACSSHKPRSACPALRRPAALQPAAVALRSLPRPPSANLAPRSLPAHGRPLAQPPSELPSWPPPMPGVPARGPARIPVRSPAAGSARSAATRAPGSPRQPGRSPAAAPALGPSGGRCGASQVPRAAAHLTTHSCTLPLQGHDGLLSFPCPAFPLLLRAAPFRTVSPQAYAVRAPALRPQSRPLLLPAHPRLLAARALPAQKAAGARPRGSAGPAPWSAPPAPARAGRPQTPLRGRTQAGHQPAARWCRASGDSVEPGSLPAACVLRARKGTQTRQQQASKPRQRSERGRAWPSRLEVVLQRLQGRRNQVVRGAWAVWLQQATTG